MRKKKKQNVDVEKVNVETRRRRLSRVWKEDKMRRNNFCFVFSRMVMSCLTRTGEYLVTGSKR